jgi:hypothetical protein
VADGKVFETSISLAEAGRLCLTRGASKIDVSLTGDRGFESVSLQQRVSCELDFGRDAEGERYLSLLVTSASSTPIACRRLTDCSPTAIVPPISHAPRRGQIPIEPAAPTVPLLPRSIGSRGCQGPLDVGSGSGQALRSGRVLRSLRRCVCAASEEVRGAIGLRHGVDLRSTGRSLTGQANAATVAPVFM